ncbi:MAG: HAD family phosphatase [Candidatus Latescibacteria bacterium]|jgi:Cof subfamily protein (haloacid dehalogenase superfamily)|nr:HAD family phosphatase [Candidatus Latescibacterota bacterium]
MKRISGLFAIDVDGTLITDQGHITDRVYDALKRAVSANWEIVIASGRTFYAAKRICSELPFLRYGAFSNGACIMDVRDASVVHMVTIPSGTSKIIVRIMRNNGIIPALYTTNQENQQVFYDSLDGACEFFEWYVTNDRRCELVDDVMAYTGDVIQIGAIAKKKSIFDIRDALVVLDVRVMALPFESSHFGGKNEEFWFLQIIGMDAMKHIALKRLADMLDIPEGRLVAVGDNYNDTDMIANADVGVAMGNAPEEVKKLAQVVVGSNNDSGLSEVVDRVLLSGEYFSDPD